MSTGSGYGLKISVQDRDKFFKKSYKQAVLHLEGQSQPIEINIDKPSFWDGNCRELVSKEIGQWLIKNKLSDWEIGQPPRLNMIFLGENNFQLKREREK